MNKSSKVDVTQTFVAVVVSSLFVWFGWASLLTEQVETQINIKGKILSTHLSGADARWYTGLAFLASAAVAYFGAKAAGLKASTSFIVASAVFLHPLLYVLAKQS